VITINKIIKSLRNENRLNNKMKRMAKKTNKPATMNSIRNKGKRGHRG